MKTIKDGVRYDTEKAILIGEATGGSEYVTDFSYWSAGLYMTPISKRYFIAGEGGPMTMFARRVDQNSRTGGAKIEPMTREDAFEWAQAHLTTEQVEAHFSDMIED